MAPIVIEMSEHDFDRLTQDAVEWSEANWKPNRFMPTPKWDWKAAYWVGDSWADVMLMRAYLQALGENFEVVHDEAEHPNGQAIGWLILTNYKSPHPAFH